MTIASPLIIGATQLRQLAELRERSAKAPIDMPALMKVIETPEGRRKHMQQMDSQTVSIPTAFLVSFSIEIGHPCGTCRHMSMSSIRKGRSPTPEALWMIADALGFVGGLHLCQLWLEKIARGEAINVVQPLAISTETEGLAS